MHRRQFLFSQYSSLDLLRLQMESEESERRRRAEDAAAQVAIRLREQQRAMWNLQDAICRFEPFAGNPDRTDAKAVKAYRDALKRAINSLKD